MRDEGLWHPGIDSDDCFACSSTIDLEVQPYQPGALGQGASKPKRGHF